MEESRRELEREERRQRRAKREEREAMEEGESSGSALAAAVVPGGTVDTSVHSSTCLSGEHPLPTNKVSSNDNTVVHGVCNSLVLESAGAVTTATCVTLALTAVCVVISGHGN